MTEFDPQTPGLLQHSHEPKQKKLRKELNSYMNIFMDFLKVNCSTADVVLLKPARDQKTQKRDKKSDRLQLRDLSESLIWDGG